MYNMYVEKCRENKNVSVSHYMYRHVFNNNFNLGFGSPNSDTCSTCEVISDDNERELHKAKANRAFEVQRIDREKARREIVYITVDMEKHYHCQNSLWGEAFYLRQLWLYNTGVHLISKKN